MSVALLVSDHAANDGNKRSTWNVVCGVDVGKLSTSVSQQVAVRSYSGHCPDLPNHGTTERCPFWWTFYSQLKRSTSKLDCYSLNCFCSIFSRQKNAELHQVMKKIDASLSLFTRQPEIALRLSNYSPPQISKARVFHHTRAKGTLQTRGDMTLQGHCLSSN